MWYYKYDGLGRRIAKECPLRDLKIEFVWDGDQLAYTQTLKNDELQSRRHSVFNGWQLIAQQDWYSELEQNHNGNIIHQRAETSYAITQPNGKVLALLSPEGKSRWKDEPKSIWGLRLNALFSYAKPSPLNPQMLFAGQWLDEESGLAYNRFRYYDPTTANYLCSDPIGLQGGENPYGYVHNPWDFVDPFGLAGCSSDARKLAENLGNKELFPNHDAHHLVMSNSKDPRMIALRDKMDSLGIDINSKNNGIWLPNTASDRLEGSLRTAHKGNGIHGNAYKQFVYDKLKGAKTAKEFKQGLKEIKEYLNSGNVFPLSNGKIPTF